MYSDVIRGNIAFIKARDVRTGKYVPNMYNGNIITDEDVARANRFNMASKLPEGFDADTYLRLNPDVAKTGTDPAWHWLALGHEEGRRWR
jgi:hypothetical protein